MFVGVGKFNIGESLVETRFAFCFQCQYIHLFVVTPPRDQRIDDLIIGL